MASNTAFRFDTKNIPLFNPRTASERIKSLAKRTLAEMLGTTSFNIKKEAPHGATHNLFNEINTELRPMSGRVFAGAPYSIIIEKGRRAKPVAKSADDSLMSWLRKSHGGMSMLAGVRKMMTKKGRKPPTKEQVLRSALFLLKRSMKKKKRKANPFFARGIEKAQPFLKKSADKYIKDLAKALAK
jgi:hypothetical protein